MKQLLRITKKGWKRGVSIVAALAVMLSLLPANQIFDFPVDLGKTAKAATDIEVHDMRGDVLSGEYVMRRVTDTLTVFNRSSFNTSTFQWSSSNPAVVDFSSASAASPSTTVPATAVGTSVSVHAWSVGTSEITLTATDNNGDPCTYSLKVTVKFSIEESLNVRPEKFIARINSSADRGSLILDMKNATDTNPLQVVISDQAAYEAGKLNLLFSSGSTSGNRTVDWESSNKDVFEVNEDSNHIWTITAMGVGHATLRVTVKEGTDEDQDEIEVYVRPKLSLLDASDNVIADAAALDQGSFELEDTQSISLDNIKQKSNPLSGRSDKIVWVIAKPNATTGISELVKDSLGNGTGDISLGWVPTPTTSNPAAGRYVLKNAQAGQYTVLFYTAGTYSTYDEVRDFPPRCEPFYFWADIYSNWSDKEKTINVGGTYTLEKALKIPESVLKNEFRIDWDTTYTSPSDAVTQSSNGDLVFEANKIGNARFTVTRTDPSTIVQYKDNGNILPINVGDSITVTIHVGPSLQVSTSETTMKEGSRLGLSGIFSAGEETLMNSDFTWDLKFKNTTSEDVKNYLEIEENEATPYLSTLHALKVTPDGNPVVITLHWSTEDGVTQSASCEVTITKTATEITLDPTELTLATGTSQYVTALGLSGQQNLVWTSTDEEVFTVQPNTENTTGYVTAGTKVGTAILVVMNPDNNVTATCTVTVTQEMTDLKIREGDSIDVDYAKGFVTLHADYEPTNATSTGIKWSSSDPKVATVDEDGTVRFLAPGSVVITVASTNNPTALSDTCIVNIITTRIEKIELPVKEINIIKGNTYQLVPKITPENPYDNVMTWKSENESIATVKDGLVTAVAVGSTIVTVSGGVAEPVSVIVNVTDKLESIAFDNETETVEVGNKITLNVVFTPSENVNKNLTFTSTNPDIATVDEKGVVTGVAIGDVMMIAVSEELGSAGAITCMIHVVAKTVYAEDFAIDPTEKTIKEGETFEITPIFTPENPTDQTVEYSSSNEAVATVSVTGIVTGVSVGTAVISCTYVPTGRVAICMVTVESSVVLKLSPTSKTIVKGRSFTIKKTVTPSTMNSTAVWKSSNTKVATVSAKGKVKAKKAGTAVITCKLVNYNISATCRVKVVKVSTTIKLNKSSIRINVGQKYRLTKTVKTNDTKTPTVKFTSKRKKIATVGAASGVVRGRKVGSTVITARTSDAAHATAKCRVTVIRRVTSVKLNKAYAVCFIGRTIKLKATVKPTNASIKKLKWTSSDPNIAAVDQSGRVSGITEGEVYITVATTDGSNKSDRCFVRVMEEIPASSVTVAQTKLTMKKGDTATLSYTILPVESTDTISMASDNKRVAKVTNDGKVTAVGTGSATITIMTSSGVTSTVEVHVVDLNKTSMTMRQYDTETLFVTGTDDTISWYSANSRIASVENGKVVARGLGTTYIYAYVDGCKLACKVQVVSVNTNTR